MIRRKESGMKKLEVVFCSVLVLFLWMTFAYGQQAEIRILYVNDFHGFAEPHAPLGSKELLGGIPYLAKRADELRKEKPSLLLSAGDMIQGNNWANLFQGESVIEWMNAMRFDAMVVGNHEFDFGQEVLKKRISEARFPILGANVEGLGVLNPYVIRERMGVKVALIGIVTEDVPLSTHPRNVAGLRFFSPEETANQYVKELRKKANVIVVLSHIGFAGDRRLAERVKGIDVIVGGHSHTKIRRPVKLGETLIVQAWEHGKALGVLDLMIKDGRVAGFEGHLEEIRPERGQEEKTSLAILEKYEERVDVVLHERIGEAAVDLDGENVRKRETNLGDFIADIMRKASGADGTLINGGSIRTSIKKGEVRMKDVYSVLPFDNYIVAIRLTGKQIKEALEHGVSAVEEGEGRFPQVSGFFFNYFPAGEKGARIKEISVGGRPIDPDKEYLVATNDFLAAGGDGYKAFGEAIKSSRDFSILGGLMKGGKVVYSDSGKWLRDVVAEYIKERKQVAPKTEGRIVEIR